MPLSLASPPSTPANISSSFNAVGIFNCPPKTAVSIWTSSWVVFNAAVFSINLFKNGLSLFAALIPACSESTNAPLAPCGPPGEFFLAKLYKSSASFIICLEFSARTWSSVFCFSFAIIICCSSCNCLFLSIVDCFCFSKVSIVTWFVCHCASLCAWIISKFFAFATAVWTT